MESLERELREVTTENRLPGVMLAATNFDGSFNYREYFGRSSLENGAKAVSETTTVCLASATKLATSVAAMQCVERGLIGLEDDVTLYLPELKNVKIFTGIKDGKPILKKVQNIITLSHLLTHTSGIASLEEEEIMEYYQALEDPKGTLLMRYFMSDDDEVKAKAFHEIQHAIDSLDLEPLLFEPGASWLYGRSTDWVGQLIERLTNLSLESYCQVNIFTPLGMKSTTFRPGSRPHIAENLMEMAYVKKDGTLGNMQSIYPLNPTIDLGGAGLYTTAPDYISFLASLLRIDGKLLKPQTIDLMLDYRVPDEVIFKSEKVKGWFEDSVETGMDLDHCLCGVVNLRDLKIGRKAGGVQWGGATRCHWWIDRAGGVCGFYGSQIFGPGERLSSKMYKKFQAAVYAGHEASAR